jgi:hypothetical protein
VTEPRMVTWEFWVEGTDPAADGMPMFHLVCKELGFDGPLDVPGMISTLKAAQIPPPVIQDALMTAVRKPGDRIGIASVFVPPDEDDSDS